jgi:hypothetical protein
LGRGPDRWAFSDGFHLSVQMSVYCSSPQSLCAVKLHLALGSAAAARVGVSRRRSLESSVQGGSKVQFVISVSLEVLFACTVGQLSSISFLRCTCICIGLFSLLDYKYRYALSKKKTLLLGHFFCSSQINGTTLTVVLLIYM